MFAYNPTVNDRSGEILGAGQMQAAATNAQAMSQMGQDIGGALKSIGGTIGDVSEKRAQGESAFLALQQMAEMYPSMKKMVSGLEQLDEGTRGMAASQVLGNFGALSQFAVAGMNNSTRRDQQALTARQQDITINMPNMRNLANNQADDAAGRTTYSPPAGLPSAVPPPMPVGFGSINQGMPGAMTAPVVPNQRPMARRPGGS
jgi:hypothetical protein